MGQFDFLDDDRTGGWRHEPVEIRESNVTDAGGKRIGFRITRAVNHPEGHAASHMRCVSITKDGEWAHSSDTTYHATREEAEAEVERRVRGALKRYAKIGQGVVVTRRAGTVAAPRQKAKPFGCARVILAVVVLAVAAFVAAMIAVSP